MLWVDARQVNECTYCPPSELQLAKEFPPSTKPLVPVGVQQNSGKKHVRENHQKAAFSLTLEGFWRKFCVAKVWGARVNL